MIYQNERLPVQCNPETHARENAAASCGVASGQSYRRLQPHGGIGIQIEAARPEMTREQVQKAMCDKIGKPWKRNLSSTEQTCRPNDNVQAAGHRVILVSGDKHCGKTTLVERLLASLDGRGLRIQGILAIGFWENHVRAGFDLVNLSDGGSTPLARRRHHPHPQHKMMFDFLDNGMRAGAQALDCNSCRHADILVVDELGRLEARGGGWAPHVKAMLSLDKPVFVFVVRLDCLQKIGDLFGFNNPPVIDAREPDALDHLRAAIESGLTNPHPAGGKNH